MNPANWLRSFQNGEPISLKMSIAWNSAGNIVYLVCQWLLTYIVVIGLGYEQAGILSLAMIFGNIAASFALYSMRSFQSSDVIDEFSKKTYVISRVITAAAAFAVCLVFVLFNNYPGYTAFCIIAFLVFKVSEAFTDVYHGILQQNMRLDGAGASLGVKGIVLVALFAIGVWGLHSLAYAIVLIAIGGLVFSFVADRKLANLVSGGFGETSSKALGLLLKACLPVATYGLLFTAFGQLPRYYLELVYGTEQLGYYATIAMPTVIVQTFASFFFNPLATPIAQAFHDGKYKEIDMLLRKVLIILALLTVFSVLFFYFLGDPVLWVLFGDSILPWSYLLMPLVACTLLTGFSWFLGTVAVSLRVLKPLVIASVIGFALVVFLGIPFLHMFGLNGASFVLILGLAAFVCIMAIVLIRVFRS